MFELYSTFKLCLIFKLCYKSQLLSVSHGKDVYMQNSKEAFTYAFDVYCQNKRVDISYLYLINSLTLPHSD